MKPTQQYDTGAGSANGCSDSVGNKPLIATKRSATLRRIVLAALAAWLVFLVALIVVWITGPPTDSLLYELAKSFMQVLIVVAIGGVVTFVIDRYQYNQAKATRREELLRATLDETIDNYHHVKYARRLLRAQIHSGRTGDKVDLAAYDKHLASMNDAQLNFERLKRVAPLLQASDKEPTMAQRFRTIETYLNELCGEYEKQRRLVAHDGADLDALPKLKMFLVHRRSPSGGSFKTMADPFHQIVNELRSQLLEPFVGKSR